MATFAKSTFSHASYAAFRPSYPPSLYSTILKYHNGPRDLLVDLGTGHGLVARAFSKEFKHVIGTDPSPGMIEQAIASTSTDEFPNVKYQSATSEEMPPFIAAGSVDIVVAGQAAHWFDYPRMWPELARVMRSGATVAFWGYTDCVLVDYPRATAILSRYAYGDNRDELGQYWSQPGRSIVEGRLRAIVPPQGGWEDVQRIEYVPGTNGPMSGEGTVLLKKNMSLDQLKIFARTWSAFHGWQEAHPGVKSRDEGGSGDVIDRMGDEMMDTEGWIEEPKELEIEWGSGILMTRKR